MVKIEHRGRGKSAPAMSIQTDRQPVKNGILLDIGQCIVQIQRRLYQGISARPSISWTMDLWCLPTTIQGAAPRQARAVTGSVKSHKVILVSLNNHDSCVSRAVDAVRRSEVHLVPKCHAQREPLNEELFADILDFYLEAIGD